MEIFLHKFLPTLFLCSLVVQSFKLNLKSGKLKLKKLPNLVARNQNQCVSNDAVEIDGYCYVVRGPLFQESALTLCRETDDTFLNVKPEMQSILEQLTEENVWTDAKWNVPKKWGKKKGRRPKYYRYNLGEGEIVRNIYGNKVKRGGKRSPCLAYYVKTGKHVKTTCLKKNYVICKEGIWASSTPLTSTLPTTTTTTIVTTTVADTTTTTTGTSTIVTTMTTTTTSTTTENSSKLNYLHTLPITLIMSRLLSL